MKNFSRVLQDLCAPPPALQFQLAETVPLGICDQIDSFPVPQPYYPFLLRSEHSNSHLSCAALYSSKNKSSTRRRKTDDDTEGFARNHSSFAL